MSPASRSILAGCIFTHPPLPGSSGVQVQVQVQLRLDLVGISIPIVDPSFFSSSLFITCAFAPPLPRNSFLRFSPLQTYIVLLPHLRYRLRFACSPSVLDLLLLSSAYINLNPPTKPSSQYSSVKRGPDFDLSLTRLAKCAGRCNYRKSSPSSESAGPSVLTSDCVPIAKQKDFFYNNTITTSHQPSDDPES